MDKRINLDALISRTYKFDEINEGFRLLTHGRGGARRHRVLMAAPGRQTFVFHVKHEAFS